MLHESDGAKAFGPEPNTGANALADSAETCGSFELQTLWVIKHLFKLPLCHGGGPGAHLPLHVVSHVCCRTTSSPAALSRVNMALQEGCAFYNKVGE